MLVTVADGDAERLVELAEEHGVADHRRSASPAATSSASTAQFEIPLDELRAAWTATLPAALG